jgi:hypothetical protein
MLWSLSSATNATRALDLGFPNGEQRAVEKETLLSPLFSSFVIERLEPLNTPASFEELLAPHLR